MSSRIHPPTALLRAGLLVAFLTACSGGDEGTDDARPDDVDEEVSTEVDDDPVDDIAVDDDQLDDTTVDDEALDEDERGAQTTELFARFGADSPGCAVAVRYADDQVFTASFGAADLAAATAITDDTIFDIGSVSKQITAGVIALLVVEGRLDLDDDVTDLVEELGPYDDVITVDDLIHHTSGLPDYIDLLDADDDEVTTMADALAVIASPNGDPVVAPGTEFEYSNTNYVLLSIIAERVSGRSLADLTGTEIFGPLDMDSSVIRDDQGTLLPLQAQGYADEDGWVEAGSSWRQTGDGAVHSTASDLLLWADLFLDDPTSTGLGSQEWLDLMVLPGSVSDTDGEYGGGIELVESTNSSGGPILRHGGSWIGYGSALTIEPAAGVAAAVTCNIDGVDAEGLAEQTRLIWS